MSVRSADPTPHPNPHPHPPAACPGAAGEIAPGAVWVSIIIPTLNEAANLPALLERIDRAMAGRWYEVLIVDDGSVDDTVAVCADLARRYPLHLHVRPAAVGGLSGAVLHGIDKAGGNVLVAMDADLQHPPEKLPELIGAVEAGACDFALGSRYAPGGSTAEKWGLLRRMNSRIATVLARPFAGKTRDPMSGFFALKRETFDRARRLTPLGYKIGLELMCKCRVGCVCEIPIHFDARAHGRSKLTLKQQFKYLEHLSRLYDFTYPRLSPIVKFLIAVSIGWLAGLAIYEALLWRDVAPGISIPLAYLGAIASTAVFHLRYVRTQREFLLTRHPWRDFVLVSLGEFIAAALAGQWLVRGGRYAHAIELFVFSFGAATVARYVLRKELMQDIRGLRKAIRQEEVEA